MLSPSAPARWHAPDGPWTEPDLHLFPQDGHRYEIVEGGLHVSPPTTEAHDALVESMVGTLRPVAPAGWWVCSRIGIATPTSNVVPDVMVLRPRVSGSIWVSPAEVALVVEVEAEGTRSYDRFLKPAVYAAADIPAFWRVELTAAGPVVRVYALDGAGGYRLTRSVEGAENTKLDAPYPVKVAPATWR
ncbi:MULTISPECIES: Uma2 family endonuclease [Actinoplanes]|uniref:Uma2 family endonuclease n=1 Tax=Actinoplanes TaxID=1865 RepID=UPI0005F2AF52|nr:MULTISPECIES: Uma2 family endonuclease [Actinoplanes]